MDPARTLGPFVHRPPFWRARELLRMRRVNEGHARNLVGAPGGRHLHVQAAVRMAYQHVGALRVGVDEQGVQFGATHIH